MLKKIGRIGLIVLLALLLVVGGYVVYVFADYYRLEDRLTVEVGNNQSPAVQAGVSYQLVSYNIGFGAYEADYDFFMDGGKQSWAWSEERLSGNLTEIAALLARQEADFYCVQEVDRDATRSYHVDEQAYLVDAMGEAYASLWAQNYDSPFLFYPFYQPHGKSLAGITTMSRYRIDSALRRSLPVEEGVMKLVDLDRCYSVSRVPVENGKELVLYNVHLSAYSSDGSIANQQLEMLLEDMEAEYRAGNYAVCAGDFNKDLLGDSSAVFGVSGEAYTWAQSFPFDMVPEVLELAVPYDESAPVPTCRNADAPYDPATAFVLVIDGFIVSENVKVEHTGVLDTQFAYSDHNPVQLSFVLE